MHNRFFSNRANNIIRRHSENITRNNEPTRMESIISPTLFFAAQFTLLSWFLNRLDGLSWRERMFAETERESEPVFPRFR